MLPIKQPCDICHNSDSQANEGSPRATNCGEALGTKAMGLSMGQRGKASCIALLGHAQGGGCTAHLTQQATKASGNERLKGGARPQALTPFTCLLLCTAHLIQATAQPTSLPICPTFTATSAMHTSVWRTELEWAERVLPGSVWGTRAPKSAWCLTFQLLLTHHHTFGQTHAR